MFWINLFSKSAQELDFQGLDVFSSLPTAVVFKEGETQLAIVLTAVESCPPGF